MNLPAHRIHYSWADYLALEASSNVKHEFLDGQIYRMAGGTPEHAALTAAVSGLLFAQLRNGRCRVHDADLRVRVLETGLATYPDVTIVCGRRERDPEDPNALTNPTLIVEVLSKSTEEYDRGDKFEHYKRIPSLRQYVLVSYRARELEVWTRGTDGWTSSTSRQGDGAKLDSISSHLSSLPKFTTRQKNRTNSASVDRISIDGVRDSGASRTGFYTLVTGPMAGRESRLLVLLVA